MKTNIYRRSLTCASFAIAIVCAASGCLAAKGGNGNGGGKPRGGDDPPAPPQSLPVTYNITAPTMPDAKFYFNDHNEQGSAVGWNLGGAGPDKARPVVYLPEVSTTQAFYLDDPAIGLPPMPLGYENWHTRSAVAINNRGDIGGSIEPFGNQTNAQQPFLLTRSGTTPELIALGRFDNAANREFVLALNDSGDTLIVSTKTVNDVTESSYFIGNPGLYGNAPQPFEKLQLPTSLGYSEVHFAELSNRLDGSQAVLAGSAFDEATGDTVAFRMNLDGSDYEEFQSYQGEDGNYYSLAALGLPIDLNDAGDVSVLGLVSNKPGGKGRSYGFPAVWSYDSDELVAVTGGDTEAAPASLALINNSDDALIGGSQDLLWHSNFSPTEGLVSIADAIDSNDPNLPLFQYGQEITDHGSTGWPAIFAVGSESIDGVNQSRLLILTPELVASAQLAGTAVPEPQSLAAVFCCLLGSLLARRRQCSVQPSLVKNCN